MLKREWSGRKDLNLRPPGPEPGALARLRYAPNDTLRPALSKRELQLNTSDCGWGTATRVRTACRKREPLGSEAPRRLSVGGAELLNGLELVAQCEFHYAWFGGKSGVVHECRSIDIKGVV